MAKRATFVTKLGVIAATVGSSVGLGNIWRFPYETGQNGGAAFLLVYILCVLFLGLPVMLAEFVVGRSAKANVNRSFLKLAPGTHWNIIGYMGVFAPVFIMGFYSVMDIRLCLSGGYFRDESEKPRIFCYCFYRIYGIAYSSVILGISISRDELFYCFKRGQ